MAPACLRRHTHTLPGDLQPALNGLTPAVTFHIPTHGQAPDGRDPPVPFYALHFTHTLHTSFHLPTHFTTAVDTTPPVALFCFVLR